MIPTLAICSVGELFGGVERHILGLLVGLRSHGVTAPLILFHDGELASQARQHGFEVLVIKGTYRSFLTISRRLGRVLHDRNVQVVHAHGYKAIVHCALARCWHRFALIKTEHGMPEHTAGKPIQRLRGRFYHLLDAVATGLAVNSVCYVTDELRTHHGKLNSSRRAAVIANGVSEIDRGPLPRPAEYDTAWFNVAIVGRVDTVKGHRFAVEAVAVRDMPSDLHLHVIGTGPCEVELRTYAKNCGIEDRVHFHGFRRNIYDYLAHCDALVMPSLHEGLPYTLLEAMALATPIIGSRVGGLAEVLENEVTALLVPPGNVPALADAIRRLHADKALGTRLGNSALRIQKEKYSLGAMMASYLQVYVDSMPNGNDHRFRSEGSS